MKYGVFVFGVMAGLLTCTSVAETAGNARWIGVWQGQLDGQPGVILTLADDGGELGGTIVLNGVSREGGSPHVVTSELHVLVHGGFKLQVPQRIFKTSDEIPWKKPWKRWKTKNVSHFPTARLRRSI